MPWSWALPGAVAGRKQAKNEIEAGSSEPVSAMDLRHLSRDAAWGVLSDVSVRYYDARLSYLCGYEFAYRWAWREHLEAERWQPA